MKEYNYKVIMLTFFIWLDQPQSIGGGFALGEFWTFFHPNPNSPKSRCLSKSIPFDNNSKTADTIKCYDELGCLQTTPEWFHLLYRPINLLPQSRQKINTQFLLYNRNQTERPIEIYTNQTQLYRPIFYGTPIKIIVHGFLDQAKSFWVTELALALLLAGDFNILVVDWAQGSSTLYPQAAGNTRLVALEIVHLIQELARVDVGQIHCIGHSLGSHICGYVGNSLPGFGRITGLDPAEPLFQYMPEIVRLSPDDAKFVDVIHTDGQTILLLGYGMSQSCGHLDFYPNDGKNQPGCEIYEKPNSLLRTQSIDEATREIFACDHHRAIFYFTESILNNCQFVGHKCKDYATYLRGECSSCGVDGSNCALLGLEADKYQIGNESLVNFFMSTGKSPPFCGRHYRVRIELGGGGEKAKWVQGQLKMSLQGSRSCVNHIAIPETDNLKFEYGTNLTFLIQSSLELGEIERVRMDWKYDSGYFNVTDIDLINTNTARHSYNGDTPLTFDKEPTSLLISCGTNGQNGISSGSYAIFRKSCPCAHK